MCWNWKLWAGIAAVVVGVAILAPVGLGVALPLLLIAACPLGMVLMGLMGVGMMGRHRDHPSTADDTDGDTNELRDLRAEVARLRHEAGSEAHPATAPR